MFYIVNTGPKNEKEREKQQRAVQKSMKCVCPVFAPYSRLWCEALG